MNEALVIERAKLADLDAIHHLLLRQFDEHDIELEQAALGEAIAGVFADEKRGFFIVAREAGDIIAVAALAFSWTLEHGGQAVWLDELYVLPERRNCGVGTRLLHRVEQEARALGCAAIDLEVDREHERAEQLYRREGYEPLPRSRWVRHLN